MKSEIVTTLTNENILKQSNELNVARYKLGALSLDILSLFLTQVRKGDTDFKEFRITHKMLEERLNKSIQRDDLRKIPKDIMSNPFYLQEGKTKRYFNWCSNIAYNESEHWLEFKMDNDLKKHVINVKKEFVLTDLSYITKLKNTYSKRMYSLIKQFESTGFYRVSVDKLSDTLDTTSKYASYGDFKKRCITPSLKQINEFSDLYVTLREIKSGRRVTRLEFTIKVVIEKVKKAKKYSTTGNKKGVDAVEDWLNEDNVIDTEIA